MKHRLHIQPLLVLIILTLFLVSGTLYTTRHAINDFEHISYSQRTHYKTFAITQMAGFYFHTVMSTDTKAKDGIGLGKFLEKSLSDPGEGLFIIKWDPQNNYPVDYIGGHDKFKKYYSGKNFWGALKLADSLGIADEEQLLPLYHKAITFQLPIDETPTVVKQNDGKKYLITWAIIPSPTPDQAKYLCAVLTPTAQIDQAIDHIKMKYVWLFSGACAIAGIMLILIPITIRKCAK